MRINDVLNEGLPGGEYSRVLTALKLYYPDKFSMQELNTPEWHRVIANKADVPMEYAGDVIDGFVKASQRNDDDEDDDYDDEQGVAEASWNPVDHGDFPVNYDADTAQDAVGVGDASKWKAMTQYYSHHINVTRALDDLYRAVGSSYYDPVHKPVRFVAKLAHGYKDRSTETKYFDTKDAVYQYAKSYGRTVLSIEKVDTSDDDSGLIKLPVLLGVGTHKKKWILPFPDENYAQKWQFKHKNIADIQWPAGHALAESIGRAVNDKGLTQHQWLQLVQTKFPDAKIVCAKMIDGPCRATLPDGRTLSWTKVDQGTDGNNNSTGGVKPVETGKFNPEFNKALQTGIDQRTAARDKMQANVATLPTYTKKGVAEGDLNEFAADDGDRGGEDDALRNYARMWWAGDEATQMQIERALAKMGWEIGEDEGGYDNGGVFVVRAGDENGNSYQSWPAEDLTEGVAEGDLNEFVPAGRGPGDDDEEPGDDPYKSPKPEAYGRSIDFFGRFEADHFDKERMDDATGVFKGYWDYDGDMKQIAYFKFDDPARTGSDDPGMGWYYEPQNESVAEGIDDEEYGPELAALKKEFGKFTQHYDRMDQDSAYAAQWRKQNTDRLNREVPDDDMTGTATDDMAHDMGQDDEDSIREGKPKEKEADYGADYQDMVSRVKKLAGLGPLKTVYDPQKRVYKNVPTAVQPKKEQR